LVEADGSRQRPLKAPGKHEPPIPSFAETVLVVAGLSGLGKPLDDENVHRPEIFGRLSGLQLGELVHPGYQVSRTEVAVEKIPEARRVALLNQADTPQAQAQADSLVKVLLQSYHSVIIASLKDGQIHAVREPIAGIVLAAGASQRYGGAKQLLDWRGKPFVRAVAQTALEAGLAPVIVVTGEYADKVESAVND
jgi:molybdenum cofactor cytidylyltransferase